MKDIIKNQKLFFISLIGIVVVSLVMGTTYAYQTLQVDYEEGSSSNLGGDGLQTPKLEVNFNVTCKEGKTCDENNDNYNRINLNNMPLLPDYKTADYTEFTLTNNSTADVAYKINLIDITYSPNLATSDFKYTVTEIEDGKETIKFEGDFSGLSSTEFNILSYTYLEKEKTKTTRIYLWLLETESEQNGLENTSFQGKVEIESIFITDMPKLSDVIIASAKEAVTNNDSARTLYNETFDLNNLTGISATTDRMLALAEDDYGTSYVFRGAVKDNYVNFAGFTWRIVRINGDGSVRLILDGTLDRVKREGLDVYAGTNSLFVSSANRNIYVGYMYGLDVSTDANRCLFLVDGTVIDKINDYTSKELCEENNGKWTTTAYEATHANIIDNKIKKEVDKFYENYIENDTYHFEKYLADSIICGDKSLAKDGIGGVTTQLGYGTNNTYYAATERLWFSSGTTSITSATPTLKCASGASNNYSRYTKDVQTINGVSTNGDLTHSIGLLSADELVMAGAFNSVENQSYYLYDAYSKGLISSYWYTITPYNFNSFDIKIFNSIVSFSSLGVSLEGYLNLSGIRPIVNLKTDLLVASGNGTESNPYQILEY